MAQALGEMPEVMSFESITVGDHHGQRAHSTPFHELVHVQQGRVRMWLEGSSFEASSGDTFLVPRGTSHRDERLSEGPYRTFYAFFSWASGDRFLKRIDHRRLLQLPAAAKHFLHLQMTEFEREYSAGATVDGARLSLMLTEILLALYRLSRPSGKAVERAASRAAERGRRELVADARSYLEEHYTEPVGLEELAHRLDVSSFHLSRSFSREFGVSLTDMLTTVRVEKARELLAGTRLSVKEIAAKVGYSGGNYFSKVFRRVSGMSPSEYRVSAGRK